MRKIPGNPEITDCLPPSYRSATAHPRPVDRGCVDRMSRCSPALAGFVLRVLRFGFAFLVSVARENKCGTGNLSVRQYRIRNDTAGHASGGTRRADLLDH